MRKSVMCTHEKHRYLSNADGSQKPSPMSILKVDPKALGQASQILVDVVGWEADTNAQVKVEFYGWSYPNRRPAEVMASFDNTGWLGNLVNTTYTVSGPFPAFVDAVLLVKNAVAQSPVGFTCEVWVTLIFEE